MRATILAVVALIIATVAALATLIVVVGDERVETFDAVAATDPDVDEFRHDFGERGESAGDVEGNIEPLQRDGQESGTLFSICTLTGGEEERKATCTTTLDFPEGSVVSEGIYDFARGEESQEFAIIGGTGDYGAARGTVTLQPQGEDEFLLSVDAELED